MSGLSEASLAQMAARDRRADERARRYARKNEMATCACEGGCEREVENDGALCPSCQADGCTANCENRQSGN